MPKISVIIPVYNNEQYLEECLNSIVNQTYRDLEIICVNDGSTDGSLSILEEFAQKDPRVIIIDQENKGQSAARNAGLEVAKGEYITFIDSEDFVNPNTYMTALEFIKENDVVCFGIKVFGDAHLSRRKADENYYKINFSGQHSITKKVLQKTDNSVCNKIFKIELLDKYQIRFSEGIHYEDAEFFFKYALVSEKIYFIDEYFYNYRRRNGSIMSQTFNGCDFAIEHLYIVEHIYDYLNRFNLLTKNIESFLYIFEYCFFFALNNSEERLKDNVFETANNYANNFKIKENKFIRLLKKRQYKKLFETKTNFLQKIFSIKNSKNKTHKIITFIGLKIKIKWRNQK